MNRHDAALSGLATSTATSTEAPLAGYLLQRSESLDSVVAAETGSGGSLAALTATMNASDSAAAGQVAATDEGLNIGLNDQSLSQTLADDQTQLTYVTTIAGDELNYVQALAPVAVNFQVASAEAEIVSAENGGDGGGDSPDSPAAVYAASALAAITGPVTQAADDNWNALNAAAEDNNAFASAATSALQQATTSETGSLAADLSADDAAGLSAIQADASAAATAIEGVAPTSVWSAGESSIVAAVNSTVGLDVSQATGSLQKEVASLESDGASAVRGLASLLAGSTAASADLMSAASTAQATSLGALADSDAAPWTPTLLSPPALPGLTGETYPGGEFGGDFGKLKFVNDGYYTSFLAPMDANLSGQSGDPDAGEYVDDFTSGGESLSNDYDSNPYDANDTDTNSNDMIVDMRFDSFDAYGAWGFGVAQAQNDFANNQQPFYSSVSLPTPSIANPPASASTAAYSDGVTTQSIDGYRDSLFTQTGPTGFWMTSGADSVAPSLDSSSDSSDSANVPSDLDVGDFALSAVTPTDSPISAANDWSGLDTAAQTQAGPTVETTLDAFATSVASGALGGGSSSGDSSDSTDTAAGGELDDFDFQNPNQAAAHLQASSLAPTNPFSEFGATGAPNNGVSATYTTNSLGQLTEEQDPNGQTIDYTYNSAGQMLTETDVDSDDSSNATETENVYNAAGQLASQSQVSGGQTRTTSYDYNSSGSVTEETDPDGKVTVFTYGAANQVTSETWYPSADAEAVGLTDATDQFVYTYNAAGELTSATDDQSSYTFTYDGYGRLLTVDNAGTPGTPPVLETYAYDPSNNSPSAQPISLTATDGDGHEYFQNLYTYDASGDETSVTQIVPGETDKSALFKYNSPGQLAEVDRYMSDLPTGAIDSDDSGEFEVPTTATPALVAKSVYGYTDGNLTSIDNTNNNSDPALQTIDDFSWAYVQGPGIPDSDSAEPLSNNGDSLPLANAATIPGGSSLPAWEVSSFTSSVDGTATYNYDADAQLRGAIYTGPTPGENYTGSPSNESYIYDDAGNRTNVNGTATDVGAFNEVLNDGTYCYCYDADGDLIRETNISTGAYTTFAYDNRNRMTGAELFNDSGVETKAIAYTYDVFNNMIARTETDYTSGIAGTPTTQEFVYAGPQSNGQMALTFQTTGATAPTMSNVTDRYLWGPAVDQILADDRTGSVAEDAILWTIDDNQNTVRDVVDSSGNPLDHITYSAYGVPLFHSAGANAPTVDTIFGYTGAYTDPTTGLQNRTEREYNPFTGTWTTSDPAGADVNSGRYVGNDPTNETDFDGEYGVAGHFYTTYIVAVAAGIDPKEAYQLAYFSQYPDQVFSYDAISVAEVFAGATAANFAANFIPYPAVKAATAAAAYAAQYWGESVFVSLHSMPSALSLQFLTKGFGRADVIARQDTLKNLITQTQSKSQNDLIKRGLLIHALADSFAHTHWDPAAVDNDGSPNPQTRPFLFPIGHGLAGHLPDLIQSRPGVYRQYVTKLFAALKGISFEDAKEEIKGNPIIKSLLQKVDEEVADLAQKHPDISSMSLKQQEQAEDQIRNAFRDLAIKYEYKNPYTPDDTHNLDLGTPAMNGMPGTPAMPEVGYLDMISLFMAIAKAYQDELDATPQVRHEHHK